MTKRAVYNEGMPRTSVIVGEAGSARWVSATRQIPPDLKPYIVDLNGYIEWGEGTVERREFAVPMIVVIFEFSPPLEIDLLGDSTKRVAHRGGFVAGPGTGFVDTRHYGYQEGVQVNMTPVGARLWFDVPMRELTGEMHAVSDVLPIGMHDMTERLHNLESWEARFDLVEAVMRERIAASTFQTDMVVWATERIVASGGRVRIGDVADRLGYSAKQLRVLFSEHVGIPPKLLAQIARFDRFAEFARSGRLPPLADLALELGYSDQAHMSREVKRFAGVPPSRMREVLLPFGA